MPYWYTKFERYRSMRRLAQSYFLNGVKKKNVKKIRQFSGENISQTIKLIFFKFGM